MLNAPSIMVMTLILMELTLFFHNIATRTETFSGPLKVTTWTTGLASVRPMRDQSLTFGSGSKDWAFVTHGCHCSHASGPLSSTEVTGSMPTTSMESQGTSNKAPVAQSSGGRQGERNDIHDLKLVLGRWGNYVVHGTNSWPLLSS
jgi:hypothetical protein